MVFEEQLGNLDVTRDHVEYCIPGEGRPLNVTCHVGHSSFVEGNNTNKVEHPGILVHGLHSLDESGCVPKDCRDRVVLLAEHDDSTDFKNLLSFLQIYFTRG